MLKNSDLQSALQGPIPQFIAEISLQFRFNLHAIWTAVKCRLCFELSQTIAVQKSSVELI